MALTMHRSRRRTSIGYTSLTTAKRWRAGPAARITLTSPHKWHTWQRSSLARHPTTWQPRTRAATWEQVVHPWEQAPHQPAPAATAGGCASAPADVGLG